MNRRDLLNHSTLAVGAMTVASMSRIAMAAPKTGLAKTASDCGEVAEECLTHCLDQLATGDKSMAECAVTVRDTIASCRALVTLASSGSAHLKEFAAVCAKICRDCEQACEKHAKHHDICKRCMEACAACAKECEAV